MADGSRSLLPIFLNIRDLPVLIVGGGRVAVRRARALLAAGASRVTVVAPKVDEAMPPGVAVLPEKFHAGHLEGQRLILAATDSAEVNEHVYRAAAERGLLCGRAEEAQLGDFLTPKVWREGEIVGAVSAGVPALSRTIAAETAATAAPWADLAGFAVRLRAAIACETDAESRRRLLEDVASASARVLLATKGPAALAGWLSERHERFAPHLARLGETP